jgi:hypothetical protein
MRDTPATSEAGSNAVYLRATTAGRFHEVRCGTTEPAYHADREWPFPLRLARIGVMIRQQLGDAVQCTVMSHLPDHLPSGAALLAIALGEEARGIRGLDVLRRSVDRAPPVCP